MFASSITINNKPISYYNNYASDSAFLDEFYKLEPPSLLSF